MTIRKKLSVIVLAAGLSSRMGTNKLLLPLGTKPVLQRTLDALNGLPWYEARIVFGRLAHKMEQNLEHYTFIPVFNPFYKNGMASSIRQGTLSLRPDADGIAIALGDTPFLQTQTVRHLFQAFEQAGPGAILRPMYDGKPGHPVIFSSEYRKDLLELSGDSGAKQILKSYAKSVIRVAVQDPGVIGDIDTPQAYRAALEKVKLLEGPDS